MSELITVVGANGNVGRRVAERLLGRGLRVRVLVRDETKADGLEQAGAELARADIGTDELAEHFEGAGGAFLMVPILPTMEDLGRRLHEAAVSAGIRRVVRLSAFSPIVESGGFLGRSHAALDADFAARPFDGAVLRPEGFMQNLLGMAPMIQQGQLINAAGEGKTAFIDADDIAACAVSLLAGDRPCEGVHDLTGPEALSWAGVASAFSDVLDHEVTYTDVPVEAYLSNLSGVGLPDFMIDVIGDLVRLTRSGAGGFTTDAVESLTGSKPRSLREWIGANRAAFEPGV